MKKLYTFYAYARNEQGKLDDGGKLIWINEFYIAPKYRNNGVISKMIAAVTTRVPWATHGYFKRAKHNNRISIYPKNKWIKIMKRYAKKED